MCHVHEGRTAQTPHEIYKTGHRPLWFLFIKAFISATHFTQLISFIFNIIVIVLRIFKENKNQHYNMGRVIYYYMSTVRAEYNSGTHTFLLMTFFYTILLLKLL